MSLTSDQYQHLQSDPQTDSTVMNGEPFRVTQPGAPRPIKPNPRSTSGSYPGGINTSTGKVAGNSPGYNAAGPVGAVPVKPNPNRNAPPKPGSN